MVVAHEIAHIRHRDTAKFYALEWLLLFHFQSKPLRQWMHLLLEMRADREVSRRFDPFELASLLVKMARPATTDLSLPHATGGVLGARVEWLLQSHDQETATVTAQTALPWLCILGLPTWILLDHHMLETLVGKVISIFTLG